MIKVYFEKYYTRHGICAGEKCYEEETGKYLGTLKGSVGPYGESTGIFEKCKTTAPMAELGLTE